MRLLFIVFSSFCISLSAFSQSTFSPQYPNDWKKVDDFIRGNWDTQLWKSNDLPNIYIGAWPYLPFMFYWDTYFNNIGLIRHNMEQVAKWNTENLLFVVDKYGYMGNAAVTSWGMNRSQPPYLSQMVKEAFYATKDTNFLRKAYYSLKKEYVFWTDTSKSAIEDHNTAIKGLQRFYHHAKDEEIEPQFKEIAERFGLKKDVSFQEKVKFTIPYIVEAATGMDFTPRFEHRCQDFVAVELNCLLYNYEENFEWMKNMLKLQGEPDWAKVAQKRKSKINQVLWNDKRGLYLDYDYVNKRHSKVAAATAFQPMWAGIASKEQAERMVKNLPILESEWGITTTEKCGEIKNYQWGETSIWPPMQVIVITALDKYGYKNEAKRLAMKYLDLVAKNFLDPIPASYTYPDGKTKVRKAGTPYEKYKADGTINDDEYMAHDMMGWSAATFVFCYQYVNSLQ